MLKKRLEFGIGRGSRDLIAALAGLDFQVGLHQGFDRLAHMPAPQQPQQPQQRQRKQRRTRGRPAQLRMLFPGIVFRLFHAQTERMSVDRRLIAVAAVLPLFRFQGVLPAEAEAERVELKLHVPLRSERGERGKERRGPEHHHDRRIGFEMAVEQIAREVQLSADEQEARLRVLVSHCLEDLSGRGAAVLDQSRAALARAEGVDAVDLLVPEDQKDRPVDG